MLDSEIVAAIVAGDADGLAAAYDRYAAPLYAFCCSLLTEPADAADAVQDTVIIARARLAGLHDPDLLRSWLYAVARNECHRRLAARGSDATAAAGDDTIDLGIDLDRAASGEVVAAAIAALPLDQREVIELSLRQDFDSDDLASTLGVSASRAQALASDARGQFRKLLGTLLVARSGRWSCRKLDEILDDAGGQLTGPMRQRLNRHILRCRACSGRKRRELEPALLLGVLPVTAIARGLRSQVLGLVGSSTPEATAYRDRVVWRAGSFQASGFPVPIDPPSAERRLRPSVLAVAAAAALALLCALVLEFGLHHHHPQQLAAAAPPGGQPPAAPQTPASSSSQAQHRPASSPARHAPPAPATPAVTPALTPTPPASLLVSPSGTPAPRSSPPVTPSRTPTPTPTPSQTPGTLSASPASVTLGISTGGGALSGSFTLTASGSAVSYSILVPSAYAGELAVSPSSGTLAAGTSVTVVVTWNSSAALQTGLIVDPDGLTVGVSYQPPTG